MAVLRLSTTARNALANALATTINANGNAGTIKIYSGSQPADPQTAPSGTLLATITLPNPPFGSAATGVITANAITQVNAGASGTAGWAEGGGCRRQRHSGRGRGHFRGHHQPQHHRASFGRPGGHHQRHADHAVQ